MENVYSLHAKLTSLGQQEEKSNVVKTCEQYWYNYKFKASQKNILDPSVINFKFLSFEMSSLMKSNDKLTSCWTGKHIRISPQTACELHNPKIYLWHIFLFLKYFYFIVFYRFILFFAKKQHCVFSSKLN